MKQLFLAAILIIVPVAILAAAYVYLLPHAPAAAVDSAPLGVTNASPSGIAKVAGIAVTDTTGHAIPCETMLGAVRLALNSGKIAEADRARATDFQSKATERCNADEDAQADAFSAQALALATN